MLDDSESSILSFFLMHWLEVNTKYALIKSHPTHRITSIHILKISIEKYMFPADSIMSNKELHRDCQNSCKSGSLNVKFGLVVY